MSGTTITLWENSTMSTMSLVRLKWKKARKLHTKLYLDCTILFWGTFEVDPLNLTFFPLMQKNFSMESDTNWVAVGLRIAGCLASNLSKCRCVSQLCGTDRVEAVCECHRDVRCTCAERLTFLTASHGYTTLKKKTKPITLYETHKNPLSWKASYATTDIR